MNNFDERLEKAVRQTYDLEVHILTTQNEQLRKRLRQEIKYTLTVYVVGVILGLLVGALSLQLYHMIGS